MNTPLPVDPEDVPTPVDFCQLEDARAWERTANVKRPWREQIFARIASELQILKQPSPRILELGSGPGFLAERILKVLPAADYTLLDFSPAMHELARARLGKRGNVRFVTTDFKREGWAPGLGPFDAVVTVQAVHELRHKRHVPGLHRVVRGLLRAGGAYLVCDHIAGSPGMENTELYMTVGEQVAALETAGFENVSLLLEVNGLALYGASVPRTVTTRTATQAD